MNIIMKRKLLTTALCAVIGAVSAWAAPVSQTTAKQTAIDFATAHFGNGFTAKQILTAQDSYYIVNLAPQGWVIVAADDAMTPIIGSSATGAIDWHTVPDAARWYLNTVGEGVRYLAAKKAPRDSQWDRVALRRLSSRADDGKVEPLIKMKWGQSSPYNKYCPGEGSEKAIVGCVAVAMAQAMSVQQWPNSPTGSMTYGSALYGTLSIDFDAQPSYNWTDILSGANKWDGAARLMWHTGMSVKMDYGPGGSGIPSNQADRISTALTKYFGYGSDVKCTWRSSLSGNDAAKYEALSSMIYNELSAGRAVVYNALSMTNQDQVDAGHSFNIDGYDPDRDAFHLNWGWNGSYDGYFAINALNVAGYQYNYSQVVITGIGSPNRVLRAIDLTYSTIDENLPAGTVVGLVKINGEAPTSGMELSVRGAYQNGAFPAVPFNIQGDRLVTTQPLSSTDPSGCTPIHIEVVAKAGSDRLTAGFTVNVMKERTVAEATNFHYDRATNVFTLYTKHGVTYTLTNAQGATVGSGTLEPLPMLQFNRSLLTTGTNVLTLKAGSDEKKLEIKL